MKRISKIIISFILFFIFTLTTEAKDCVMVSGTGKNIGDEVACGTEHFYVIENDGANIKMLAKYNLRTGFTFEKVTYEEKVETNISMGVYQNEKIREKMIEGYKVYQSLIYYDSTIESYKSYGAIMSKNFDSDRTAVFFDQELLRSIEIYNKEEIKKYLDEGYLLEKIYYSGSTTSTCSNTTTICQNYINGASFYKIDGYDYVNILFDEEVAQSDLENYLLTIDEVQEKINEGYTIKSYYQEKHYNSVINYIGVILEKKVEKKYGYEIFQSEKAIGAHGDESGNPEPVEVAVIPSQYMWGENFWGDYTEEEPVYNNGFRDYYYDSDSLAYSSLNLYYDTLISEGFDIIDVNSVTVSEINNIVKTITGQELPLEDWYNDAIESESFVSEDSYYVLGSLKKELPEEYNWLWKTTYWTRTADPDYNTIYFVDTLGDLCAASYCAVSVGAGIRPVVTISSDDIIYKITTKTDGNGTLTASHETADPDHEITFEIKPAEGYVLGEVKVIDEDGNVITFTDYKFTMPSANVIIEATFVPHNPDTSDIAITLIILGIIICTIIFLKSKYKLSWIN